MSTCSKAENLCLGTDPHEVLLSIARRQVQVTEARAPSWALDSAALGWDSLTRCCCPILWERILKSLALLLFVLAFSCERAEREEWNRVGEKRHHQPPLFPGPTALRAEGEPAYSFILSLFFSSQIEEIKVLQRSCERSRADQTRCNHPGLLVAGSLPTQATLSPPWRPTSRKPGSICEPCSPPRLHPCASLRPYVLT